jgi:hypothetical protein
MPFRVPPEGVPPQVTTMISDLGELAVLSHQPDREALSHERYAAGR